jgi:hypothetical protein
MIYFYRAQATSGRLSQDLIALKEEVRNVKALVTSQPCGAPSAGKTSASAIAVREKPELPPKVHRLFSSGVQIRLLSDPTQQVTGQNKKENIRTFSIASKPVVEGVSAGRKILQDTMPLDQANACMENYGPKNGVSEI